MRSLLIVACLCLTATAASAAEPLVTLTATPETITLVIANPGPEVFQLADGAVGDRPYSAMQIQVRYPAYDEDDRWYAPLPPIGSFNSGIPEPTAIQPGQSVTVTLAPSVLTRGLTAIAARDCRYRVRAAVRDADRFPWSEEGPESGAVEVESDWVAVPCRTLFEPLAPAPAVP